MNAPADQSIIYSNICIHWTKIVGRTITAPASTTRWWSRSRPCIPQRCVNPLCNPCAGRSSLVLNMDIVRQDSTYVYVKFVSLWAIPIFRFSLLPAFAVWPAASIQFPHLGSDCATYWSHASSSQCVFTAT